MIDANERSPIPIVIHDTAVSNTIVERLLNVSQRLVPKPCFPACYQQDECHPLLPTKARTYDEEKERVCVCVCSDDTENARFI
jgi:hypothetical protein